VKSLRANLCSVKFKLRMHTYNHDQITINQAFEKMDQPNSAVSQRNYEQRLSRVTRYIYEHLNDPLDLIQLAEIACMSPYHWHRIYQAIHGESVIACVKRLRLHRAANYLSNSSKNKHDRRSFRISKFAIV